MGGQFTLSTHVKHCKLQAAKFNAYSNLVTLNVLSQRVQPNMFTRNKVSRIHTAELPKSVGLVKGCIPGNPLGTGLLTGLLSRGLPDKEAKCKAMN